MEKSKKENQVCPRSSLPTGSSFPTQTQTSPILEVRENKKKTEENPIFLSGIMDSRKKLAALLSSLVSQLIQSILLLFRSSSPIPPSQFNSDSHANVFTLIRHFLLSQEIAATVSVLSLSRKRRRTHVSDPGSESVADVTGEGEQQQGPRVELGLTRTPDSFQSCFKMTSLTFEWLSGLLEPLLECRDPVELMSLNLSAPFRLGIGLCRLATGVDYPIIAQQFGVSDSVARFCVKQLCRVLCTNFRFWVSYPSPDELQSISQGFESISGMPNCSGVIDCTRFRIFDKGKPHINSIAAQIVVDSSSRILNIVAGFNGDKSNLTILKNSTLYKDVLEGKLLNSFPVYVNGIAVKQYLIGDSGYPLLPWIIVPFTRTLPGSVEENFNSVHTLMRVPMLRAMDSLKNWGVLNQTIQEELKMAVAYVGACSILHNILLMREDFSALSGDFDNYPSCYQGTMFSRDSILEDNLISKTASDIRSTLAATAKRVGN